MGVNNKNLQYRLFSLTIYYIEYLVNVHVTQSMSIFIIYYLNNWRNKSLSFFLISVLNFVPLVINS